MNPAPRPSPPDLLLERHRLGELDAEASADLARRVAADPGLAERLASLDASDAEILRRYPAREMAREIRARARVAAAAEAEQTERTDRSTAGTARASRARGGLRPSWLVPAAAALLAALAVVPLLDRGRREPEERLKGTGPSLVLYRKTAAGSETLEPGASARAGDLVRVGYRAAGRKYGVVVSVDARGSVTLHLPASGGSAEPLAQGKTALLPFAFELDDAPSWERFYLVTSDAPFAVATVLEAARASARDAAAAGAPPLRLPGGLSQSAFVLGKESR